MNFGRIKNIIRKVRCYRTAAVPLLPQLMFPVRKVHPASLAYPGVPDCQQADRQDFRLGMVSPVELPLALAAVLKRHPVSWSGPESVLFLVRCNGLCIVLLADPIRRSIR